MMPWWVAPEEGGEMELAGDREAGFDMMSMMNLITFTCNVAWSFGVYVIMVFRAPTE